MIDGRQNPPINIADLLSGRVLWPEFFELDGMIFLTDGFDHRLYDSYSGSFRKEIDPHGLPLEYRLESLLNQRYLKDLFLGTGYVPDRKVMLDLGKFLEQSWQAKLSLEFPGRQMQAEFHMEYANTGFAGWWMTVCRALPWGRGESPLAKKLRKTLLANLGKTQL